MTRSGLFVLNAIQLVDS